MASTQQTKRLRMSSTSGHSYESVIETSLEDDLKSDCKSEVPKDLLDDLTDAIGSMPKSSSNDGHHQKCATNQTKSTARTTSRAKSVKLVASEDADNLSDETEGEEDEDYEEEEEDEDDDEEDDDDDDEDENDEDEDEDEEEEDESGKNKARRTKKQRQRHRRKSGADEKTGGSNKANNSNSGSSHNNNNNNNNNNSTNNSGSSSGSHHTSLQKQLAASGPAGVAAAAAIATVRKRRRPHTFETNPSVRKRQQTRLIRKLRACIDEYTARVGQQAVVLITMPGKTAHNFKVFGAQPLESVVRSCKDEIMSELEQAVLEQTPIRLSKEDNSGKQELPPLVIDGIPTPVEKMTQAQLRAFIPLMLKYSTGRGKPGWGKESTRPPWWPTTLPWANVRSDARDEIAKQCISWTTTLREIVTNCYKFHGREDLLPIFDEENDERASDSDDIGPSGRESKPGAAHNSYTTNGMQHKTNGARAQRPLGSASTRSASARAHNSGGAPLGATGAGSGPTIYQTSGSFEAAGAGQQGNFVQTVQNADGTVSLIQVDAANSQILTLPDGTQVRAVRLQSMPSGGEDGGQQHQHQHHQLIATSGGELHTIAESHFQAGGEMQQLIEGQQAELGSDGQIILTSEDGTQSCYPMSQLVSIPASVYQQFAASGQPLQIISADGSSLTTANAIQIHTLEEAQEISAAEANQVDQLQQVVMGQSVAGAGNSSAGSGANAADTGQHRPNESGDVPASQQQKSGQEQGTRQATGAEKRSARFFSHS